MNFSIGKYVVELLILYAVATMIWGGAKVHLLLFHYELWKPILASFGILWILGLKVDLDDRLTWAIKIIFLLLYVGGIIAYAMDWTDELFGATIPKFIEKDKTGLIILAVTSTVVELLLKPFSNDSTDSNQ